MCRTIEHIMSQNGTIGLLENELSPAMEAQCKIVDLSN